MADSLIFMSTNAPVQKRTRLRDTYANNEKDQENSADGHIEADGGSAPKTRCRGNERGPFGSLGLSTDQLKVLSLSCSDEAMGAERCF